MTIKLENQLRMPSRDFEADTEAHVRNIRALELWAALPADFFALMDHDALPDVSDLPLGSLVRVGDDLYWLKTTGWTLIS